MPVFMGFTIQDWLIAVAFFIIFLCILEIRRFKKSFARELERQLLPQLILYIDKKDMCFYLKNEGYSVVQDIKIEDAEIILEDSGFKIGYILRFENIDFLKPKEGIALNFKVFDKDLTFLPEATERLFCHLINPPLKIAMTYSDIEGRYLRFIFSRRGEKFYSQRA